MEDNELSSQIEVEKLEPTPAEVVEKIDCSCEEPQSTQACGQKIDCFELDPTGTHKNWHRWLLDDNMDIKAYSKEAWHGIPYCVRGQVWMILSELIPPVASLREPKLKQKRTEYFNLIEKYYETRNNEKNKGIFNQISIDIPRTHPAVPVVQDPQLVKMMSRVLYTWAMRHPSSSYVQGLNDLHFLLILVFLWPYFGDNVSVADLSTMSQDDLNNVEADTFWMLSMLLDQIQDSYTPEQPGIRRKIITMINLIKRVDVHLYNHLHKHEVNISQFAFKWINNLSLRELNFESCLKLWDVLWIFHCEEGNGFSHFHTCFCVSFLCSFSSDIQTLNDFHEIMRFVQNLPTKNWTQKKLLQLCSLAYVIKSHNAAFLSGT